MAACGAKTRSGEPCKKRGMPNGRCANHGGKSTGAPKGNTFGKRAGSIYSKFLTAEEEEFVGGVALGKLDDEIKLARLQVLRVQRDIQAQAKEAHGLEVVTAQVVERGGDKTQTIVKQRRDLHGILDRALGRVTSLELARMQLMQAAQDEVEVMPTSIIFEVAPPIGEVRVTMGKNQNEVK